MEKLLIQKMREQALHLLRTGITNDPALEERGTVHDPLPGYDQDDNLPCWFIGITVENKIAGFIVLGTDLRMKRYWTFQREKGTFNGCPDADDWLNPDNVVARARTKAHPGAVLTPPYLTFDKTSDRVVWAVDETGPVRKTVYVAGDYVYFAERSASR